MNKIYEWFTEYREQIGYVVGTLNLLTGLDELINGDTSFGILFLVLGTVIILDAKVFGNKR